MDLQQLASWVVKPALQRLGLYSRAAVQLVLATGLHESGFRYLAQVGGPALGPFQCEPRTHNDIVTRLVMPRDRFRIPVQQMLAAWPGPLDQLASNWMYAAAICRMHYFGIKSPLPEADHLVPMAEYWKAHYNTIQGRGTVAQFVKAAAPAMQVGL